MKVYAHDDLPGDQREAHDSGVNVSVDHLKKLKVSAYVNLGQDQVDEIAKERKYINRDVIEVSPTGFPDVATYEAKIKSFYTEHIHEDEEIRYILDGRGYFDIRDKGDESWIRIEMVKGDMIILPPGIYHRFTTSKSDYIRTMRLFQEEPKWIPHNRPDADSNPFRVQYLQALTA
jgi:1,2-dihydroxy-3-keto-5-methylthiopentene dioxygenase